MPSTMPEFEMPPEQQAPSGAPTAAAPAGAATHAVGAPPVPRPPARTALDATDLTAEPEASDDRPRPRARLAWRQLLVAGLVGALLGAAVPASLQALERAAAAAEVETLRALATDYLTAIAEGRAADATALVPLASSTGEIAPDAVLAAARPIGGIEVGAIAVDGETATVAVRHRGVAPGRLVLEAERAGGTWRLTTSLAEPITVFASQQGDVPTIAGAVLTDRRSYLYPGSYELDEVAGPVFVTAGDGFAVDGDPATPVEVFPITTLLPRLAALANEAGLRAVEACMAAPGCAIAEGTRLTAQAPYVQSSDARGGTVDLGVQLMASAGMTSEWFELQVRMHVDEHGAPTRWECGRPGEYGGELAPCPGTG